MADVCSPNSFSVSGNTHELGIGQGVLNPWLLFRKSTQSLSILRVF
jgi:hypothetical protein